MAGQPITLAVDIPCSQQSPSACMRAELLSTTNPDTRIYMSLKACNTNNIMWEASYNLLSRFATAVRYEPGWESPPPSLSNQLYLDVVAAPISTPNSTAWGSIFYGGETERPYEIYVQPRDRFGNAPRCSDVKSPPVARVTSEAYAISIPLACNNASLFLGSWQPNLPGTYLLNVTIDDKEIMSNSTMVEVTFVAPPFIFPWWSWLVFAASVVVMFIVAACAVGITMMCVNRYHSYEQLTEIDDWTGFGAEDKHLTLESILDDPGIRHIPWSELHMEEHIATGGGGAVFRARWVCSGDAPPMLVAAKQLHFTNWIFSRPEELQQICLEIKVASSLKHDHILPLLGISIPKSNEMCLITEYMPRGSLETIINAKGANLPSYHRFKLAADAAKGLHYLHARSSMSRSLVLSATQFV